METFISFVVIAYNEENNIGRTLDSITALSGLEEYELLVVNDGSRDRTAEVVLGRAEHNSHIRLIDLPENRGRGYARSTGIAEAKGELIAQVDADILLPEDWLIRTKEALTGHDAVAGTAVPDGDVAFLFRSCALAPRAVHATSTVTGNNGLYRRRVFELAAFSRTLRFGEDYSFNQEAAQRGLSFTTVPGLLVEHNEDKTYLDSVVFLFFSGKDATRQLLAYRKVRVPDLATAAFVGSVAAGILVAVYGSPWAGIAIPVVTLLGASTQHVRSRFETPWSRWMRVTAAIAIDSTLLLSYFTGRLVGLSWLTASRHVLVGEVPAPHGESA